MKECTLCNRTLPLDDFGPHKNGKFGKNSRCRFCQRTLIREIRQRHLNENPVEYRKQHCEKVKEYQKLNPIQTKNSKLKTTFNITFDQYEEMRISQNNCCAICLKPETHTRNGKIRDLVVDHCHTTGKIRQLLCNGCNTGLGQFKDNQDALLNAIEYLKRNK